MNTTSQIAIVGTIVCPIESLDYEYFTALWYRVVLATTAAAICAYIAPGSGIPGVKAYLNGVDNNIHSQLNIRFNTWSFSWICTWKGSDRSGRLAAAFHTPIGVVIIALEEAASWWRSALLWRTFFTTAVVADLLLC
ncbi:hypothetical protein GUJ93_ZPchr0004g38837 [Zizania palustris]|uniref:Uncharacterized protein n=1 Tax=Zizania palustris TaxID=103762 RepID=A0A8J5S5G3_ZIZPA|nr:hypothetical protein GUJ93_ZPchr0004g38837 [Zizania palustris]